MKTKLTAEDLVNHGRSLFSSSVECDILYPISRLADTIDYLELRLNKPGWNIFEEFYNPYPFLLYKKHEGYHWMCSLQRKGYFKQQFYRPMNFIKYINDNNLKPAIILCCYYEIGWLIKQSGIFPNLDSITDENELYEFALKHYRDLYIEYPNMSEIKKWNADNPMSFPKHTPTAEERAYENAKMEKDYAHTRLIQALHMADIAQSQSSKEMYANEARVAEAEYQAKCTAYEILKATRK